MRPTSPSVSGRETHPAACTARWKSARRTGSPLAEYMASASDTASDLRSISLKTSHESSVTALAPASRPSMRRRLSTMKKGRCRPRIELVSSSPKARREMVPVASLSCRRNSATRMRRRRSSITRSNCCSVATGSRFASARIFFSAETNLPVSKMRVTSPLRIVGFIVSSPKTPMRRLNSLRVRPPRCCSSNMAKPRRKSSAFVHNRIIRKENSRKLIRPSPLASVSLKSVVSSAVAASVTSDESLAQSIAATKSSGVMYRTPPFSRIDA
mmetsp:Transcript_54780/g.168819  ORF Transcript_54780/g.168819 Transcript_54780/m.168819 type:complete len:270 (+) Transcript_54780:238-1047(+)